jgi:hypothetical protein
MSLGMKPFRKSQFEVRDQRVEPKTISETPS